MSLCRCAACGSKNVKTDSRKEGIKYDFVKGAIGTVVLGSGGALAGIKSGEKKIYVCPDCGITLTYCMPDEIRQMIDLGVTSQSARSQLKLSGMSVDWEFLKNHYKNIETGAADQSIAESEEKKRQQELHGTELVRNYGTATQEEFDEAIEKLLVFDSRMALKRNTYHEEKQKDEYTPDSPPTMEEYLVYCASNDIFVENYYRFTDFGDPNGLKYKSVDDVGDFISRHLMFYVCRRYFEQTEDYLYGLGFDFSKNEGWFFNRNPFCCEMIKRIFSRQYEKSNKLVGQYAQMEEEVFTHCLKEELKRSPYVFINCSYNEAREQFFFPPFQLQGGLLCYHDATFRTSKLRGSTAYIRTEDLMENYFSVFPDEKENYLEVVSDLNKRKQEKEAAEKQIPQIEEAIKSANSKIYTLSAEIDVLQKKVFGKKKALLQISEIEKELQKARSGVDEYEKELKSKKYIASQTLESEKDFYRELWKKYNNMIVWHAVVE